MLTFNGRALPAGVKMLGYTLWSPEVDLRTIDIPEQRGLMRTGSKIGSRVIRFDLVMEANNTWQATEIARKLRAWCMGVGRLKLPRMTGLYLEAECETFPAPDMSKHWEPFECSFRCFRPEFISEQELSEAAPGTVYIGGNLSTPVLMTFTLASDTENPVWGVDDHQIAINGTLTAGTVVIDTDEEHAKIISDGDDVTGLATLESDLALMLEPGEHTITAPTGVTGTCAWHNRFM